MREEEPILLWFKSQTQCPFITERSRRISGRRYEPFAVGANSCAAGTKWQTKFRLAVERRFFPFHLSRQKSEESSQRKCIDLQLIDSRGVIHGHHTGLSYVLSGPDRVLKCVLTLTKKQAVQKGSNSPDNIALRIDFSPINWGVSL